MIIHTYYNYVIASTGAVQTLDHTTAGIESVVGFRGPNAVRELISMFNDYYLKRFLQKDPTTRADEIAEMYRKVSLKCAYICGQLITIIRKLLL